MMQSLLIMGHSRVLGGSNVFLGWIGALLLLTLFLIMLQSNPVYSIFSFIFIALLVCTLFLVVGAEFFALLVLIIYTGVITVLFLFVLVMYNLGAIEEGLFSFSPYWLLFILLFCKVYFIVSHFSFVGVFSISTFSLSFDIVFFVELFNKHYIVFLICGLLLLSSMIGSVVLTSGFINRK